MGQARDGRRLMGLNRDPARIGTPHAPLPAVRDGQAKRAGATSPARPTVREVRARIPAEVSARSLALGLTVFFAALILYCAAVAAVLLAPWWPLQIACAILAGLFIATSFVVGHDACHGSLTPYDRLNKVLGRIAFLPSWTPYASWEFAHNRVHHSYTNLRGKDYAWAPLSKDEYDSLSAAAPLAGTPLSLPLGAGLLLPDRVLAEAPDAAAEERTPGDEADGHVPARLALVPRFAAATASGPHCVVADARAE